MNGNVHVVADLTETDLLARMKNWEDSQRREGLEENSSSFREFCPPRSALCALHRCP